MLYSLGNEDDRIVLKPITKLESQKTRNVSQNRRYFSPQDYSKVRALFISPSATLLISSQYIILGLWQIHSILILAY